MFTIETIRSYPQSKMFLRKDGKRVLSMDRGNCKSLRVGDTETRWVEYDGLKIFYNHKNKVLSVE